MNVKQIKLFTSIVEHGSLSAAAKNQYVTVQAVSKAIKNLERELGEDLLVRGNDGASLTPFGEVFFTKALPAVRNFEELESFGSTYFECLRRPDALRCALRSPSFYNNEWARKSIAAFISKGIGVDTTVDLACDDSVLVKLSCGDLDAVISLGPMRSPDTDCIPIGTVPMGVTMAADHPLAQEDPIQITSLKNYPVATVPEFAQLNDYLESHYSVKLVNATEQDAPTFFMADQGVSLSVCIAPLGALFPGAVTKMLALDGPAALPICLVTMKDRKTPAYRAMERLLTSRPDFLAHGLHL